MDSMSMVYNSSELYTGVRRIFVIASMESFAKEWQLLAYFRSFTVGHFESPSVGAFILETMGRQPSGVLWILEVHGLTATTLDYLL
jgi:hypothetical protein